MLVFIKHTSIKTFLGSTVMKARKYKDMSREVQMRVVVLYILCGRGPQIDSVQESYSSVLLNTFMKPHQEVQPHFLISTSSFRGKFSALFLRGENLLSKSHRLNHQPLQSLSPKAMYDRVYV
jgi:hypothetical protein